MIFFRRRKAIKLFRKIERYLYCDDRFLDDDHPSEKRAAQREAYKALAEAAVLCLGGRSWRKISLEDEKNDR